MGSDFHTAIADLRPIPAKERSRNSQKRRRIAGRNSDVRLETMAVRCDSRNFSRRELLVRPGIDCGEGSNRREWFAAPMEDSAFIRCRRQSPFRVRARITRDLAGDNNSIDSKSGENAVGPTLLGK